MGGGMKLSLLNLGKLRKEGNKKKKTKQPPKKKKKTTRQHVELLGSHKRLRKQVGLKDTHQEKC